MRWYKFVYVDVDVDVDPRTPEFPEGISENWTGNPSCSSRRCFAAMAGRYSGELPGLEVWTSGTAVW